MGPLDHYMLAGAGRWNRVAVTETLGILDQLRNCDDQDRYPDAGGISLPDVVRLRRPPRRS